MDNIYSPRGLHELRRLFNDFLCGNNKFEISEIRNFLPLLVVQIVVTGGRFFLFVFEREPVHRLYFDNEGRR